MLISKSQTDRYLFEAWTKPWFLVLVFDKPDEFVVEAGKARHQTLDGLIAVNQPHSEGVRRTNLNHFSHSLHLVWFSKTKSTRETNQTKPNHSLQLVQKFSEKVKSHPQLEHLLLSSISYPLYSILSRTVLSHT